MTRASSVSRYFCTSHAPTKRKYSLGHRRRDTNSRSASPCGGDIRKRRDSTPAHEGHAEKSGADETKSSVRDHPKKCEQSEAFEGPAEGDPFALELQREDETEEEQRRAALPGEARVTRSGNDPAFLDQIETPKANGRMKSAGRNPWRHPG